MLYVLFQFFQTPCQEPMTLRLHGRVYPSMRILDTRNCRSLILYKTHPLPHVLRGFPQCRIAFPPSLCFWGPRTSFTPVTKWEHDDTILLYVILSPSTLMPWPKTLLWHNLSHLRSSQSAVLLMLPLMDGRHSRFCLLKSWRVHTSSTTMMMWSDKHLS